MKPKLHFELYPVKRNSLEEDIVRSFLKEKKITDSDVGSSHPGGEAAPKGLAVRQLKWYVSWVQTVNSAALNSNI
jgi:hypothetical protein